MWSFPGYYCSNCLGVRFRVVSALGAREKTKERAAWKAKFFCGWAMWVPSLDGRCISFGFGLPESGLILEIPVFPDRFFSCWKRVQLPRRLVLYGPLGWPLAATLFTPRLSPSSARRANEDADQDNSKALVKHLCYVRKHWTWTDSGDETFDETQQGEAKASTPCIEQTHLFGTAGLGLFAKRAASSDWAYTLPTSLFWGSLSCYGSNRPKPSKSNNLDFWGR